MAVNNRTELKSQVITRLQATLELSDHRGLWNDDLADSIVLRSDEIKTETPVGGNVTVDFSNKDLATFTISVGITISFNNIENGDVKYIAITKQLGNTIAFSSAINITSNHQDINATETSVTYAIYNKNGVVYALALREMIKIASSADILDSNIYKFPNAKAVKDYIDSIIGDIDDIRNGEQGILPDAEAVRDYIDSLFGGTFAIKSRDPELYPSCEAVYDYFGETEFFTITISSPYSGSLKAWYRNGVMYVTGLVSSTNTSEIFIGALPTGFSYPALFSVSGTMTPTSNLQETGYIYANGSNLYAKVHKPSPAEFRLILSIPAEKY